VKLVSNLGGKNPLSGRTFDLPHSGQRIWEGFQTIPLNCCHRQPFCWMGKRNRSVIPPSAEELYAVRNTSVSSCQSHFSLFTVLEQDLFGQLLFYSIDLLLLRIRQLFVHLAS